LSVISVSSSFHAACVRSINEVNALAGSSLVSTSDRFQTYTNRRTINEPIGPQTFNVVYFSDSLTGVISINSGQTLKTTNGGVNWFVTSPAPFFFPHIKAIAGRGN
jgi:photosystem II stability/assembly factor-like uncharacterized protein